MTKYVWSHFFLYLDTILLQTLIYLRQFSRLVVFFTLLMIVASLDRYIFQQLYGKIIKFNVLETFQLTALGTQDSIVAILLSGFFCLHSRGCLCSAWNTTTRVFYPVSFWHTSSPRRFQITNESQNEIISHHPWRHHITLIKNFK